MKKTTRFKQMLHSPELAFICEAHNGLSARIVEEAGFEGIWGSGLSISAAMGVRDNNEASWTQVLEVLEFMADNTDIPILLDGDTGYGNFNNMRRLVQKLEQRDIAAVCIEDKVFPKTNSFIKGEGQPLAPMDEHCGKIKAGKDAQLDDDFCIVARTEAFIAGWGLDEALKRAEAYRQAGADAILVHSKIGNPSQVIAFMEEWDNRHPVVIVPTMYYSTPTQVFRDLGINMVIWANHILRSAIAAMQTNARLLLERETLVGIEDKLPTVKEIFRLQRMSEYAAWEKEYLPASNLGGKAILLAASKGSHFGSLTDATPKCMLEVEGQPVLAHSVATLRQAGVRDITVVTGYKPEAFTVDTVKYVNCPEWETTGEVASLLTAKDQLEGRVLIAYGDVVTRQFVIDQLTASEDPFTVVVDYASRPERSRKSVDYVRVTPDRVEGIKQMEYSLQCVDQALDPETVSGEWTGLLWCSQAGARTLAQTLDELASKGVDLSSWSVPQLLNTLVENGHTVAVQFIHDDWLDIDDILDLSELYKF